MAEETVYLSLLPSVFTSFPRFLHRILSLPFYFRCFLLSFSHVIYSFKFIHYLCFSFVRSFLDVPNLALFFVSNPLNFTFLFSILFLLSLKIHSSLQISISFDRYINDFPLVVTIYADLYFDQQHD